MVANECQHPSVVQGSMAPSKGPSCVAHHLSWTAPGRTSIFVVNHGLSPFDLVSHLRLVLSESKVFGASLAVH